MRTHMYLRNFNLVDARVRDDRRLEVVVSGLPTHNGAQVAVDATMVSPLHRNGKARPRADWQDGAALKDAKKDKEKRYPELKRERRCHLVTAGMEVGGRWEEDAYNFLVELALAKGQEASRTLRGAATNSWLRRWASLLSKAGMDSLACTLVHGTAESADLWNGPAPPLGAVLCSTPAALPVSRMGPK